jgi:hypothetical protein
MASEAKPVRGRQGVNIVLPVSAPALAFAAAAELLALLIDAHRKQAAERKRGHPEAA